MHKVETAGHAGTELGLSRLPVLKLLPGRAAIVGAQGEPTEGRSQTRGRCAGRGSPSPRQSEMQPSSLGSRASMEEGAKD